MNASSCNCSRTGKRSAVRHNASWIIPGAVLILLPKCPLCLAAMVSLLFGIGLSADAASVVHTSVIVLCLLALVSIAVRQVLSLRLRRN